MKSFNIAVSIGAIALAAVAANPSAAQDTPPAFQGTLAKSADNASSPDSSVGPVKFHGGKLINNPKLVDVYWGSLWGPYGSTIGLLGSFAMLAMGPANPVMTMIDQDYSEPRFKIGSATIGGSACEAEFILPIETDQTIHQRLQGWIQGAVQSVKLPANSPSSLYMVYVQPGTCVVASTAPTAPASAPSTGAAITARSASQTRPAKSKRSNTPSFPTPVKAAAIRSAPATP